MCWQDLSPQNPKAKAFRETANGGAYSEEHKEVSTIAKTFYGMLAYLDSHPVQWVVIENSDRLLSNYLGARGSGFMDADEGDSN